MKVNDICLDEKGNEYTITKMDVTDNATWITIKDAKDKTFAYGKKVFKSKFTIKGK